MKRSKQIEEIKNKSDIDLQHEIISLRREQFNLRMRRTNVHTDVFEKIRRRIARVKTVLRQRLVGRGGDHD